MRPVPLGVLVPVLALAVPRRLAAPRRGPGRPGRAHGRGARRRRARVVPDCRVTVTEVTTNVAVIVTTGPQGVFNFPSLRPGAYRIAAEAAGFRPSVREGVQPGHGRAGPRRRHARRRAPSRTRPP